MSQPKTFGKARSEMFPDGPPKPQPITLRDFLRAFKSSAMWLEGFGHALPDGQRKPLHDRVRGMRELLNQLEETSATTESGEEATTTADYNPDQDR